MFFAGRAEQVTLWTVSGRISKPFVKACIEGNGVQRHPDVHWRRELRPHTTHALASRTFALLRLTLHDEHVAATRRRQVICDARPDYPAPNNDHISSCHYQ